MAVASADLKMKLSVVAGGGNTTAQANPNASLGDQVSTTELADNTLHNLYDVITGQENTLADVEYRCVFFDNTSTTNALIGTRIFISGETAGGASIAIGLDPAGITARGATVAQAATVADEQTAPTGVTFSAPTTAAAGLAPGDIPAGSVVPVWIRRTAGNNAAIDNDSATLQIAGDTAA